MGKNYLLFFLYVIFTVLISAESVWAQAPGSEADVIKSAGSYFEKEDYPAAMPLYSQLLANHPNDPNYNYRFGVCMLFANADKGKALPFLEVASKDPKAEVEVWFYLGRAYHLNYRFDEAINAYSRYKKLAGEKKAEKMQVNNQIAMCKAGQKLLRAVTDISVLEKKELPAADFFRSYNLEGYSGQLLVKGDEFKSNLDRKNKETSIIFLSGEKNILYFSSYGDDESNGKDIYRVVRLPNGGWSKPFNVGYPVNSEYDEDYPFLHPNGKVLYFSSKGHNSMGGYDIFRAELNEETGSWLKPVNMDFAINSPDDDILFVTDFEEKTAWFASARNSPQGMMTVYHVMIERKPVNMCIISGKFKPNEGEGNASAKITVRNEETNQPVGVYTANEQTGTYVINLPNAGGKYTFTVEKSGIRTQTKAVVVPPQYEIRPIRQEIFYLNEGEDKNLNIITYFDDDTASFAPDFLKDKANLDVADSSAVNDYSVTDIGMKSNNTAANNNNTNNNTNDTSGPDDTTDGGEYVDPAANVPSSQNTVSTAELVASAYENAEETEKEASAMQQQSDRAFNYASNLNEQAKAKQIEADKAQADADAMAEGPDKIGAQEKANQLQAETNTLQAQTVAAYNVANGLDEDAKQKKNEAVLAKEYAKSLDVASKSKDSNAMDAADQKEKQLRTMSDVRPQGEENLKNLQEEADKKREQLQVAKSNQDDLREEKKSNEELIAKLQADAAKEKDPDLKAGYEAQIEGIRETMQDNDAEIKKTDNNVARLQNEVNQLDNQIAAANNTLNESKNTSVAPVAISPETKKELRTNVAAYQNEASSSGDYVVANNTTSYNQATTNTSSNNTNTSNTNNSNTSNTNNSNTSNTNNSNTSNTNNTNTSNTSNTNTSNTNNSNTSNTNNSNTSNTNNFNTSNTNNSNTSNTSNSNTSNSNTSNSNTTQEPIASSEDIIADIQGNVSEKIQEAENETDPAKQAEMKQEAHAAAVVALNEKIESTRAQLNNESDPTRKDQLSVNLQELQTAKEEQQKLADESKEQVVALANNNAESVQEDPLEVFNENAKAADTISDPALKSNTKAEVYTDWAAALDKKIVADKQVLSATKDKAEKDSLKNLIAAEQKQSADLKQQAKTEKANEQKAIAVSNSPASKSERAYQEQIAAASQNPDMKERETAKADVYRSWADSLNAEADKLDALAAKERNAKKKDELTTQSEQLRIEGGEKEALAQKSTDAVTQSDIATNNTNNTSTSNTNNSNTSNTSNTNTSNSTTSNSTALTESGVTYSDPQAQQELKERDELLVAAKADRTRQDSLIAASASAEGAEKNKLLADATASQRAAWEKENEASASQGTASKEQFRNNESELNAYREGAKGNSDISVEIAALQMEEAVALMSKAEAKRNEAAKATSQYQKSETLKEAEQYENQALKKQQDALASYNKAGVVPSTIAANNANTATANNSNTSNSTTNNSDSNNSNTSNSITSNSITSNSITSNSNSNNSNTSNSTTNNSDTNNSNTGNSTTNNSTTNNSTTNNSTTNNSTTSNSTSSNSANTSRIATQLNAGEQFAIISTPNKEPIPVDPPVPSGIVYKVQIGAFRNPIPVDIFQGIQPLTAESAGNGITRYTAGLFTEFANADAAKNEIRAMGYPDAFVVAFRDGKRISVADARGASNQNSVATNNSNTSNTSNTNNSNTSNTNNSNTSNTNNSDTSNTNNSITSNTNYSTTSNSTNANPATDVTTVQGLFYTVQVGVYSRSVSADKFYNVTGLFSERTANGYIRYAAGKYDNLNAAVNAKNGIVNTGIRDAFVTAYFNGQRISVERAQELERGGEKPVGASQSSTNNSDTSNTNNSNTSNTNNSNTSNTNNSNTSNTNNSNTTNTNNSTTSNSTPLPVVTNTKPNVPDTGTVFSVQLGAYRESVPIDQANRFFQFASRGISIYKDVNIGLTVYQVGALKSYDDANSLKSEAVSGGITDAFIVAWRNGQKISVEEALKR